MLHFKYSIIVFLKLFLQQKNGLPLPGKSAFSLSPEYYSDLSKGKLVVIQSIYK